MKRFTIYSPMFLAVALSAVLQTDCDRSGDTTLATLEIVAGDLNRVVGFSGAITAYEIWTAGADTVTVRATTVDPRARVNYRLYLGAGGIITGSLGLGGGQVVLSVGAAGAADLQLDVSNGGARKLYSIEINAACSADECDDANACTSDTCDSSVCKLTAIPDGILCDFTGTNNGRCDAGVCELHWFPCTETGILDAIALGGGPHTFDCNGPATVVTQAEIVVDTQVSLDGEGDLTVRGSGSHRIFSVPAGVAAELVGVHLTNGAADYGGGLHNQGSATLIDVRVASNQASQAGGGIYSGPGSELNLDGVTIEDNSTSGPSEAAGGGLYLDKGTAFIESSVVENNIVRGHDGTSGRRARGGGLFISEGDLVLEASRVAGNSVIGGDASGETSSAGYAHGGGLHLTNSVAVITNSAVSGNVAQGGLGPVGGGFASGGGIWLDGGSTTLEGTTIDSNLADGMTGRFEAGEGGGLMLVFDARLVAVNSTISGNRADFGEAIELRLGANATFLNSTIAFNSTDESHSAVLVYSDAEVTISHTIVANAGRCVGTVQSLGYNVLSPAFNCAIQGDTTGNQTDVDPQLHPLADNGGSTMTHAISETSPALDMGDPAGCVGDDGISLTSDQRGMTRPVGVCDIGAFEIQ